MKFMKEREIRGIPGETVNFMENREIHTRKIVKFTWKIVKFMENRVKFMDACEIHKSHEIHMNSLLANAHA